jgi:DNA helicase-2/ATP-dependent DNA helicase PcrA
MVAAAIIKSTLGVNIEEDLSEESMRIDYVAMTRAKDSLAIITDSNSLSQRYNLGEDLTEFFEEDADPFQTEFTGTKFQDAYSLFINRRENEAIKLRDSTSGGWIRGAISEYFDRIDRISFSLLSDISSPLQFLKNKVLNISPSYAAAKIGTDFHSLAARYREGNFPEDVPEDVHPMLENYRVILEQIKTSGYRKYPSRTEFHVSSILEDMDERYRGLKIEIHGFIDAIFEAENGPGVLLVDYKTSRSERDLAKYFLQLTLYSMLYARTYGCRTEDINIALAYVNLNQGINTGESRPEAKLIMRPSIKGKKESLFELIDRLMRYRSDTELFISDLMEELEEETKKEPQILTIDKRIMDDLRSS